VIKSSLNSTKALVLSERDLLCSFELLRLDCFLLSHSFLRSILTCNRGKRHQLCGGPCGEILFLVDLRKLTRSEGPFERGKGLKKTRPLWPPQRGVGLREPNLGKTNLCLTLYSLAICFAPSLSDSIIFLTLTRLVVVINFVNFSFALFTPPLGNFQLVSEPGASLEPNRSK
jgi:hypothetical protein